MVQGFGIEVVSVFVFFFFFLEGLHRIGFDGNPKTGAYRSPKQNLTLGPFFHRSHYGSEVWKLRPTNSRNLFVSMIFPYIVYYISSPSSR